MALVQFQSHNTENTQNRIVQEGIELWNRQRDADHLKKMQEQKEMREMLDKYWPWGSNGPKPRGLRNLRLEGIFPNKDYEKAKRSVSPLGFGGGGAPVVTHSGKRMVRTREHPVIRFQWNKDLRKCVDNTMRYKTNREQQELYKRQLDAQVAERKLRENEEKRDNLAFHKRSFLKSPPWGKPGPGGTNWRAPGSIGINFLKSLGWSTEKTLRGMTMDAEKYRDSILKEYEDFKKLSMQPADQISKYKYALNPWKEDNEGFKMRDNYGNPKLPSSGDKRKLSPLKRNNLNGEELVSLLAKERAVPHKIPLGTTDVTRGNADKGNENNQELSDKTISDAWRKPSNRDYLQELTNQMTSNRQRIKETRLDDVEMVRRHFKALDQFWGRPGHGARRTVTRKGCLDRLLFDPAIAVH